MSADRHIRYGRPEIGTSIRLNIGYYGLTVDGTVQDLWQDADTFEEMVSLVDNKGRGMVYTLTRGWTSL